MEKKVEVTILKQPFTFVGEDENRIKRDAMYVDDKIEHVIDRYGIVNTLNAVIMAMMEITDEYLEMKKQAEKFEGRTLRLIKKFEDIEAIDVPCSARDKW
jgi:cell division protein ZapA (FtsZ GTPase activity inhibitor)